MKVPRPLRTADQDDALVRTLEYDDGTVITVDFGVDADDLSVDVVGETAIVTLGDRQLEFELPVEADSVTVNNGILTISE